MDSPSVASSSGLECSRPTSRNSFEVAIICALPNQLEAAIHVLDRSWDGPNGQYQYGKADGDPNNYRAGRIGNFNVVLVILPNIGNIESAQAAAWVRASFLNVHLALVVGTCGGMPSVGKEEIILGDVIISSVVVQYDFGRQLTDRFLMKDGVEDRPGRANINLRGLLNALRVASICDQVEDRAAVFLRQLQARNDASANPQRRGLYAYPGTDNDRLFDENYEHKHREPRWECNTCAKGSTCDACRDVDCSFLGCDTNQLIRRERHTQDVFQEQPQDPTFSQPRIFVGRMGSGNAVMRSAQHRAALAAKGIIGIEMEGAGVWDQLPCLIVKGVSNYADSHKNDVWQNYAAATAVSVAKALLEQYSPGTVVVPVREASVAQQPVSKLLELLLERMLEAPAPKADRILQSQETWSVKDL